MKKLSIIIVNYNVKYFLEQCLLSVWAGIRNVEAEVFVVDNNSVDGSVEMVREKFPWAKLIANSDNKGFSRANNQAMRLAEGEYILLLNPDTVVEEDTFTKVLAFMDQHPDAGGLGVKMVDGKGHFLPESKRGLPTPETSFYKIFGLSRIFRKSKRFNRYHLGYLDQNEIHEIEILSGAFMLMRKVALDKVGLLDEAFFMYGEDIDLSWRIVQGGWKNYYFPETRIIHYKGESTKKGSLNYVFVFYNAMVIFAKKHFSEKNARLFSFLINVAIWLRAGAAIVSRFVRSIILPAFDFAASLGALYLIKYFYAESQHKIYDPSLIQMAFVSYALLWCASVWLGGGYDKPFRPLKVIRPLLVGSATLAIAYSFLPESLRFSRAILLLGAASAIGVFLFNRIIFTLFTTGTTGIKSATGKRFAIVGSDEEIKRVLGILRQTNYQMGFVANVAEGSEMRNECVGTREQLQEIIRVHAIDSVIFCAKDVSSADIISSMSGTGERDVEFKIAPPEALYIIGSNSIETSNDTFILDVNSVSLLKNRRLKRLTDVLLSLVFLLLWPTSFLWVKRPLGFLKNIAKVVFGKKTWVGFNREFVKQHDLPPLKKGVLNTSSYVPTDSLTKEHIQKLNVLYARDYRWMNDLYIVWKCKSHLGS